MFLQRLLGIFATGGRESTGRGCESRDAGLIEDDGHTEDKHTGLRQIMSYGFDDVHRASDTFSSSFFTLLSTCGVLESSSDNQMKARYNACPSAIFSVSICL